MPIQSSITSRLQTWRVIHRQGEDHVIFDLRSQNFMEHEATKLEHHLVSPLSARRPYQCQKRFNRSNNYYLHHQPLEFWLFGYLSWDYPISLFTSNAKFLQSSWETPNVAEPRFLYILALSVQIQTDFRPILHIVGVSSYFMQLLVLTVNPQMCSTRGSTSFH